jgi:oxygen-independent coproporphyrinogen-3 oxidase
VTDAAGLYVHLPYCRSRCGYCGFVVTTDDSSRAAYFQALGREADLVAAEAARTVFDSLYLGGGTPSLAPPEDLAGLLETLRSRFALDPSSEITLEANPDDVSRPIARAWGDAGVTRISVGVQSFDDRELAAVGRRHDASAARAALETLGGLGFSVSGDLILGLPGQTAASFRASVHTLAGSGVEHVSVYLLETEKSRALEEDRRRNPEGYLSDDAQAEAWLELGQTLESCGFRHYEISNWARPGREARHNLKYWTRTPTLGLGISAHELWSGRRRANVSNLPLYLEILAAGRRATALDRTIGAEEIERERIYLGLRRAEGLPADDIRAWIVGAGDERLARDYDGWIEGGWLVEREERIRFTEAGFLVSNEILCRFA